jgi:hypothetical protein
MVYDKNIALIFSRRFTILQELNRRKPKSNPQKNPVYLNWMQKPED